MNFGAQNKFKQYEAEHEVKAVEIHTGSAYGHPGIIADIHFENGKIARGKDFADQVYSNPKEARAVADREAYRMTDEARRQGVPVILHTTGRDAKLRTERNAYKSPLPPQVTAKPKSKPWNGEGWQIIAIVVGCVLFLLFDAFLIGKCIPWSEGMQFCF